MTLRVLTHEPLNAETALHALGEPLTPVDDFFIRCNFDVPQIDAGTWQLRVHGAVSDPLLLTLDDLRALPMVERRLSLECAGNGRGLLVPPAPGTQWQLGATGTAVFGGVPLRFVLDRAGVRDDALECVFTGADAGVVEDGSHVRFQRSLPLHSVAVDEALICWSMNGEPLRPSHGFPVRLVVPRYYAVASVKWLLDIEAAAQPFRGWFQADRYVYRSGAHCAPVTQMRVRSLVTSHADGMRVDAGTLLLRGIAWSGGGAITAVDVRVDDGAWQCAETAPSTVGVSCTWQCSLRMEPGERMIQVRASDAAGAVQPTEPFHNELGYGNNLVQRISLTVE